MTAATMNKIRQPSVVEKMRIWLQRNNGRMFPFMGRPTLGLRLISYPILIPHLHFELVGFCIFSLFLRTLVIASAVSLTSELVLTRFILPKGLVALFLTPPSRVAIILSLGPPFVHSTKILILLLLFLIFFPLWNLFVSSSRLNLLQVFLLQE